ncbi:hypothetical protein CVT24_010120 [Panaeolus cyanescens]|uniref:Uncharacterized protein n=1 Tax=Panaeolus cyanescens TaxID=181874 RepID=A0A409W9N6_9AGAR|nr:hypothetical protein CVT24_010120 [Panaeolus cyanescens]
MTVMFAEDRFNSLDHSGNPTESWFLKLPYELWEQIVEEVWKAPMSISDRSHFKFAIENASPVLCDILSRVAAKDIYVPWPNHLVPSNDSCATTSNACWPTRSLPIQRLDVCRSLTTQVILSPRHPDALSNRMSHLRNLRGRPIWDILHSFRGLPFLPNLRSLCVQYHVPHFSRQHYDLSPVCHQLDVVRISVEISRIAPWLWDMFSGVSCPPEDDFMLVRRPYVEFMSTTSEENVDHILRLCPHLELASDATGIDLQILETSRTLEDGCILVHGPLRKFDASNAKDASRTSNRRTALTVRGTCLAVVIPTKGCSREKDITKTEGRKLHMLVRRYG